MPIKDYQTDLLHRLANPEYAAQYLKVALDEALIDGNKSAFLLALQNVVDATEATQTKSNEFPILIEKNITLETLVTVLQKIGLTIDFKARSSFSDILIS